MTDMGIGKLAELSGVKVSTIRFYEENGLVPPPRRTEGGQRRFDANAMRRLLFIRHARYPGFAVEDIPQLLARSERPNIEAKIALLRLMRSESRRMIEVCGGRFAADCRDSGCDRP